MSTIGLSLSRVFLILFFSLSQSKKNVKESARSSSPPSRSFFPFFTPPPKNKKQKKSESLRHPGLDPVRRQPLQQRLLPDRPLPLRHGHVAPGAEQGQRRQAVNLVLLDEVGARVGVDFDDLQFSSGLLLDGGHERGDELAGAAPDGPEVDEDGDGGLSWFGLFVCLFGFEVERGGGGVRGFLKKEGVFSDL